ACQRLLAGLEPVAAGLLGLPRLGTVMGDDRGFGNDSLGEVRLEHGRDASVELLAPAAQQSLVGGILYQRMLERVFSVRRPTSAEDQFRGHELIQGGVEPRWRQTRDGADQL